MNDNDNEADKGYVLENKDLTQRLIYTLMKDMD